MKMDDDLENFLAEQKAKVAEERAILAQDPPYLEIRTMDNNAYDSAIKENIPPSKWSSAQRLHRIQEGSAGLSSQLGEDYERKKHRLQQELRLDYRRYMAQGKQMNADEGEPRFSQHDLALPLPGRRCTKLQAPSRALSDPLELLPAPRPPAFKELPRKDAATLTEGGPGAPRVRRHYEGKSHWPEGELDQWERLRVPRPEFGCSENEEEEELAVLDRRRARAGQEPGHMDRRPRRLHQKSDRDVLRFQERGLNDYEDFPEMCHYVQRLRNENRLLRERREVESPAVCEDDYGEGNQGTLSTTPKPRLQETVPWRPSEKASATVRKEEVEFATGLMIGAADSDSVTQRRKELYRQELQEQMAERQRNRKSGLDVLLRGDLAGASHEERLPPERPRVAFHSPLLDYGTTLGVLAGTAATPVHEDYHRGPSCNLGEMSSTRLPSVPLPPPSTLSDAYTTPYDDVYFYYGARDPLDPGLAHYGPATAAQPTVLNGPTGAPPLALPVHLGPQPSISTQRDAGTTISRIGVFPSEREAAQAKESVQSYQEALKQQIRERQERRRREKEESEQYEARLEAEMKTYDPWGRGGGGAPLRDDQGNLISDLNQMHKTNEEAYLNPLSRDKRALVSIGRKESCPRVGDRTLSSLRVSGFTYGQTSPFARGSVFTDVPSPQQLQQQGKYKDYLRQQIEEKRRREAEERERLRQEEEQEERRLAEQRARILREYEEEQEKRRRKEMEQKAKNEELVRQAEERRKEVERKKWEQEQKEREAQRREYERERQTQLLEIVREPSPPIPTLQKRWSSQYMPCPPSADSRRSTLTLSEHCLSGSQSPPVPARRNQLRAAAEQQGVISELSALRRQLRGEQRRLREQMQEWEGLDTPLSERCRDRPRVDVFNMARLRIQAPVRRPASKTTEPISTQNSCDFRKLRYRDYIDLSPLLQHAHHSRKCSENGSLRGSLLESESAFIDPNGKAFPVSPEPELRPQQLSARDRRRMKMMEAHSERGSEREERRKQVKGQQGCTGEATEDLGRCSWRTAEEDSPGLQLVSMQTLDRHISIETVTTEPWTRPGTSDTLKQLGAGPDPSDRPPSVGSLVHSWDGPSTYHG